MDILCSICTQLVKPSENLDSTKCGHLYHDHCIVEWIKSSDTCPHCRQALTADGIFRIYPTLQNEDAYEDQVQLKSLLDDALLDLDLQKAANKDLESKLKILTEEKEKLLKENRPSVTPPPANSYGVFEAVERPSPASYGFLEAIETPSPASHVLFEAVERSSPASHVLCEAIERPSLDSHGLFEVLESPSHASFMGFNELATNLIDSSPTNKPSSANDSSRTNYSSSGNKSSSASSEVFTCQNCARTCGSRIGLYSHEKSCLNKNPQVKLANDSSSAKNSPSTSKPSFANNSSAGSSEVFACQNCGRICGSRIGLYSHEKSCLKKDLPNVTNSSLPNNSSSTSKSSSASKPLPVNNTSSANKSSPASNEVFACQNCGRICGSRIGFYSHEKSCLQKNAPSPVIEVASSRPRSLASVTGGDGRQQRPSPSDSGYFPCQNCGRVCGSRIGLYSHEQSCMKKNLMSQYNAPTYSRVQEPSPRQQSRSSAGGFSCSKCGRVCGSQIGLFSHQRSCFNK